MQARFITLTIERCYKKTTRAGFVFFIIMDKNSYKRSFHLINLKLKDWNVAWYLDQLEITQEKQKKERKYVKKEVLRDHICLKKQCLLLRTTYEHT